MIRCGPELRRCSVLRNVLLAWLACGVLLGGQQAHAAKTSRRPNAPALTGWWETRHGDFHIVSKLSRAETTQIARDLQIYRAALRGFFPSSDIEPHVPVTILLLDRKLWRQHFGAEQGRAGVAYPADDHFYVAVNGDLWLEASSIVFHELTHVFMHKNTSGGNVPIWFDEGYADLLSTIEKGKDHVKVGLYPKWRLYSLTQEPWLPLPTLLSVSRTSPEYRSEKFAPAFYAQSWLLVHYYVFGGEPRHSQIKKYLSLVGANEAPERAFAAAFPGDNGEFELELQRYKQQKWLKYLRLSVPQIEGTAQSEVTALPAAAANEAVATWMLRHARLDDAKMQFLEEQAQDAAPTSVASLQLALAHLRKQQFYLAKPRLDAGCVEPLTVVRQALLCGDAYVWLADSKLDSEEDHDTEAGGILLARRFFIAALQIEPDNVEALTRAAYTFRSLGGDTRQLHEALEKSLQRDPNNPALAVALATVLQHSDVTKTKYYLERALANASDHDRAQHLIKWLRMVDEWIAAEKTRPSG